MARTQLAQSGVMKDVGRQIQERRERLVWNRSELAAAADVDRGTLTSIEEGGSYQAKTLNKILGALDAAEAEAGIGAPPSKTDIQIIEIELVDGSARVAYRGPLSDRAEIEEAALRMLDNIRRGRAPSPDGDSPDRA